MSDKPYLLYSDVHFHNWTVFAGVDNKGINTRLNEQIIELYRAYAVLREHGGDQAVCAGDLFHVRGRLSPTVLNPVMGLFATEGAGRWRSDAVTTYCIAGNHDLESKEAAYESSATSVLGNSEGGFFSVTRDAVYGDITLVPWHSNLDDLRKTLKALKPGKDLVIHAPVNGVLVNIPDSGLSADELADLPFDRVFVGHYHNHKELVKGKVWSIGATTHQTWGDVGSKAGFMLVWPDRTQFFASHAPAFMIMNDDSTEEELLEVEGNYVKYVTKETKSEVLIKLRENLEKLGAAGVTILSHPERKMERTGATTVSALDTLDQAVSKYAAKRYKQPVIDGCKRILEDVR